MALAMKRHHVIIFLLLLQILPSISSAVKCRVINDARNTRGGSHFNSEIGIRYTLLIMKTINYFIWDIFQQYSQSERRNVEIVRVFIQQFDGAEEAFTDGENINVSAVYLAEYKGGDLRWDFTGLLHHEMAHVLGWNGRGKAPEGLVEGMEEYVKLRASYNQDGFARRGEGDRWDEGYDFTARFLEYCEELKPGFVARLNKRMSNDRFFLELMGKPVWQLWLDYKAKYGYYG